MKILLDECLPRKLKFELSPHLCETVAELGWAGKKNGELLGLAEQAGFEVFLTLDQGLKYQQNLGAHDLAILLLRSKSSRMPDITRLLPNILIALEEIRPGQLMLVPSV